VIDDITNGDGEPSLVRETHPTILIAERQELIKKELDLYTLV